MSVLEWLAEQEWLPPLLAERAEERAARAAYSAWRETHPERRRPWESGYTDQPMTAEERALAKKALRVRRCTAETQFKDSIAEIVENYPTGDDPKSDRYQAHSFIQETEIRALFRKRWDAEAKELGYRTIEERSAGGKTGGGKSKKEIAAAWQKRATPIYRELRAKFPRASANNLADRIIGKLGDIVPLKSRVARWVSAMDKRPS
jgi:hypothetical protein